MAGPAWRIVGGRYFLGRGNNYKAGRERNVWKSKTVSVAGDKRKVGCVEWKGRQRPHCLVP